MTAIAVSSKATNTDSGEACEANVGGQIEKQHRLNRQ